MGVTNNFELENLIQHITSGGKSFQDLKILVLKARSKGPAHCPNML